MVSNSGIGLCAVRKRFRLQERQSFKRNHGKREQWLRNQGGPRMSCLRPELVDIVHIQSSRTNGSSGQGLSYLQFLPNENYASDWTIELLCMLPLRQQRPKVDSMHWPTRHSVQQHPVALTADGLCSPTSYFIYPMLSGNLIKLCDWKMEEVQRSGATHSFLSAPRPPESKSCMCSRESRTTRKWQGSRRPAQP